jgi:hypothetical protein
VLVRLLYLMAVAVGLLAGTPAERLVAVALAGVLIGHRMVVLHSGCRRVTAGARSTDLSRATVR